ncbi:MAG: hypothetical protein R3252_13710, partial [Robiginitalea sp.]|nr:hypothetical protein [Robiginitalea sp.]
EASFRRIWEGKHRIFNPVNPPCQPARSWQELNLKLAPLCLTELGASRDSLEAFRGAPFSVIYHGKRPEVFLEGIGSLPAQEMAWSPDLEGIGTPNVLFVLNPPSMKPAEQVGLPASFIKSLRALATERQVVLYLFGNPYLLRQLPPALFQTVVCAFQPLRSFQRAAALHFRGNIRAEGELSLDLDHG